MVYVDTAVQLADALTKNLPTAAFRRFHRALLTGEQPPIVPPDPDGPAGRIGRSLLDPVRFPTLMDV